MFDIGWSEIAIIAAIALVIIGPKDLPKVLHTMGKWIGKAKSVAREFQDSLDDVIREAGLDDVKKQIENVASTDLKGTVEKAVDGDGTLRDAFTFDGDAGKDAKQVEAKAETETPVSEETPVSKETPVSEETPTVVEEQPEFFDVGPSIPKTKADPPKKQADT